MEEVPEGRARQSSTPLYQVKVDRLTKGLVNSLSKRGRLVTACLLSGYVVECSEWATAVCASARRES